MANEDENKQQQGSVGPFGLPEGYFQHSAHSVMDRIAWLEEHREFAKLSALQGKHGFTVPDNYFFKNECRLELIDQPALFKTNKHLPFAVPAGYFEELAANATPDPVLKDISRQLPFSVNPGYFEKNEQKLPQLLSKQHKPARIISLPRPRTWAASAALLVLALGLWVYNTYTAPVVEVKDCGTMACLDKLELLKSKSLESLETDELYELVNSKKLEEKLDKKNAEPAKTTDSLGDDETMDELMDEI